ncbi:MAG: hypothetical protein Q9166_001904 [cf. Caloplaca sp. 2 TL-2023]
MGRKPNQLVIEYFNRGAKLEDNSNRYVHTCKACGKHFPKGRVESLVAHLAKSCPSIGREDRMRIHGQTNPAPYPLLQEDRNIVGTLDSFNSHVFTDHQDILPVSSSRSLTGLEALAEASRQLEHPAKPDNNQSLLSQLIDPHLDDGYSVLRPSYLGTGSRLEGKTIVE